MTFATNVRNAPDDFSAWSHHSRQTQRQHHHHHPAKPARLSEWKVLLILIASFGGLVLLFMDHVYLIALDPSSSHDRDSSSSSSSSSSFSFTVDVLSVGSRDRWDWSTRQQQTWGSHSSIRHFQVVHEGHHEVYGNSTTCADLRPQLEECMEKAKIPVDDHGRRYYVAPEIDKLVLFRKRPDGWLCAQRRPVIGLHRLYAERYTRHQDYPDWLLLVDDDTHYNMTIFQHALMSNNIDPMHHQVHVMVGMQVFNHWPYGGYGIALSRAALQRLYTPIYCNNNTTDSTKNSRTLTIELQRYMTRVCDVILQKNLLFESEEFHNGMSLLELMLAIQLHRRPFCWQSDWYLGWFLSHHVLLGEQTPTPFPLCPPYHCQPHVNDICHSNTSLVCHVGYVG